MSNHTLTVAVVGYGAIGRVLVEQILGNATWPRLVAVAIRSGREEARRRLPNDVALVEDPEALVSIRPDLVVECAGQEGLAAYAPTLLAKGIDVMAASTGALARPGLLEDWLASEQEGRGRIIVPAGAIAGLDGLGAHRLAGLERVTYTSIKPPSAWLGTPAEQMLDLESLSEPVVFFEGTARDAAMSYPKNANLAATVALAGLGFEDTRVRLVADPGSRENVGIVEAHSAAGLLRVEQRGGASSNPKSSDTTAFSLAHAVSNVNARLVI